MTPETVSLLPLDGSTCQTKTPSPCTLAPTTFFNFSFYWPTHATVLHWKTFPIHKNKTYVHQDMLPYLMVR